MANEISVVLADDHAMVRQGLRAVLAGEADMRVVAETGDGLEAVRLAEQLHPAVLVLDLSLPGLHGLEVIRAVAKGAPTTRIVVLSMHSSEPYVLRALRHGAAAYVLKDCGTSALIQGIREAAAGRRYLCPQLSSRAIDVYAAQALDVAGDSFETLSAREREVLQLAAEGHTNAQIGARLFIGTRTVETHRAHLMKKLGLRTQVDLVRYAIQRGLIPADR